MKIRSALITGFAAGMMLIAGTSSIAAEPPKATAPAQAKPAPAKPQTGPTMEPTTAGPTPTMTFSIAPRQTQCGVQSLEDCTKARIEALRGLSRDLRKAAALKPESRPATLEAQATMDQFDKWLVARSGEADKLARVGAAATTNEAQMQFNMQYLQLQRAMQDESRKFQTISNASKAKHDTAMNSIRNMR